MLTSLLFRSLCIVRRVMCVVMSVCFVDVHPSLVSGGFLLGIVFFVLGGNSEWGYTSVFCSSPCYGIVGKTEFSV